MNGKKPLWLFIPIFTAITADVLLTLFGLSRAYWSGAYRLAHYEEASIMGQWLLAIHPVAFIGAFMIYLALAYQFLKRAPEFWKFVLFFSLLLNHGIAAASWLESYLRFSLGLSKETVNIVIIFSFIVFSIFIAWTMKKYKSC